MTTPLLAALDPVTVTEDGTRATVGAREVTADNPRELRRLLADALYETLHAGHSAEQRELPFHLRDLALERALAGAVPHERTVARARALPEEREDGLLVELDGVRVAVPPERVLEAHPDGTLSVSVAACRPALSPGFFLVDGARRATRCRDVLRMYLHLRDPRAAIAVWARVLRHLEDREVAYRAKVLSSELLYPRRDALVVYLPDAPSGAPFGAGSRAGSRAAAQVAAGLAEVVRGMPGLLPDTSLFAERLAPGVALAWEPHDPRPGMRGLSFGQHRATAAAGALAARARGEGALPGLLARAFTEAGADPDRPARNLRTAATD